MRPDAEHKLQSAVVQHLKLSAAPEYWPDIERIITRTVLRGECWEWTGCTRNGGYGQHRLIGTRRDVVVHRHVMEALGHDIEDRTVCHRCDNPPCWNPEHLFVADQKANIHDCIAKGRHSPPPPTDWPAVMRDRPHHWQKLDREQIPEIRRRLALGHRQKDIAADFGVTFQAISKIKTGTRWAHL